MSKSKATCEQFVLRIQKNEKEDGKIEKTVVLEIESKKMAPSMISSIISIAEQEGARYCVIRDKHGYLTIFDLKESSK